MRKKVLAVLFAIFLPMLAIAEEGTHFLVCDGSPITGLKNARVSNSLSPLVTESDWYARASSILSSLSGDDFAAFPGFVPTISIYRSYTPNAFAEKPANISISSALLKQVEDENELAFVIAHELAHLILGHHQSRSSAALYGAELVSGLIQREIDADSLALRLLSGAGYQHASALQLLSRLTEEKNIVGSDSYPSLNQRLASLKNRQAP